MKLVRCNEIFEFQLRTVKNPDFYLSEKNTPRNPDEPKKKTDLVEKT